MPASTQPKYRKGEEVVLRNDPKDQRVWYIWDVSTHRDVNSKLYHLYHIHTQDTNHGGTSYQTKRASQLKLKTRRR
ncbi:hypothetical protein SEA_FORZA_66 [Gordonia phage Forza]|uniref:Uncharacterized protein n=1 Tax=Gordonia phage Forza TaxID=2571247 RepID=A0A650EZ05_9CAUD|nr:hypothetical protein PP303_gp066 [Gordonia phage Forza]QEM41535.1 hypothetical protein SEA_BOOPY_66 [Gordonia phage Boopy]QGT55059.1 hypothetical protein SEA_FORZA_66 [Gordonia phage Forza]UXE04208.1 hypothetical protein SEA_BLUENGOLD_64 [Gordonia phage BlueNGold]WBF03847.1 hypothetical protein SEA_MAREELIH_64 [Gordonia phage Mareelih]